MIWVEVLSHQQEVLMRHRFTGVEIRIGRAYDNDMVIDDPYVAPRHLRVFRDDLNGLVVEDAGSTNGVYLDGTATRQARFAINGDTILRLGRTRLRLRETHHAVAPERVAQPPTRLWPLTLGLMILMLGWSLLTLWLEETAEPKFPKYAVPALALVSSVVLWAGAWAVLSRIFAGRARYSLNLVIALLGLLAIEFYSEAVELAAFAFSLPALAKYEYVGIWLICGATCFYHLRFIGSSRLGLKAGVVALVSLGAIAFHTLAEWDAQAGRDVQNYVRRLKHPSLSLTAQQPEDAFFRGAQQLKSKLDRARKEIPSGDSSAFSFDED